MRDSLTARISINPVKVGCISLWLSVCSFVRELAGVTANNEAGNRYQSDISGCTD